MQYTSTFTRLVAIALLATVIGGAAPQPASAADCYPLNFEGPLPSGGHYCKTPKLLILPVGCYITPQDMDDAFRRGIINEHASRLERGITGPHEFIGPSDGCDDSPPM